jgi:hypothetical protein
MSILDLRVTHRLHPRGLELSILLCGYGNVFIIYIYIYMPPCITDRSRGMAARLHPGRGAARKEKGAASDSAGGSVGLLRACGERTPVPVLLTLWGEHMLSGYVTLLCAYYSASQSVLEAW